MLNVPVHNVITKSHHDLTVDVNVTTYHDIACAIACLENCKPQDVWFSEKLTHCNSDVLRKLPLSLVPRIGTIYYDLRPAPEVKEAESYQELWSTLQSVTPLPPGTSSKGILPGILYNHETVGLRIWDTPLSRTINISKINRAVSFDGILDFVLSFGPVIKIRQSHPLKGDAQYYHTFVEYVYESSARKILLQDGIDFAGGKRPLSISKARNAIKDVSPDDAVCGFDGECFVILYPNVAKAVRISKAKKAAPPASTAPPATNNTQSNPNTSANAI